MKLKTIFFFTFLASLFSFSNPGNQQESQERPNILFIFTDDHAPQSIGAYGSIINETPNLDRLAEQGMIFRNAAVTNSICGPSRAVILTGKHSHINGFTRNEESDFDSSQQTFPKLLQQAGYQTALFGKWHLGSEPTGFDEWKILPGQGNYYNPDFITPDGEERVEGYVTDVVTDLTIEWLKNNRDPNKPFMLMSQHKAPHRKWLPAGRHLTLYDDVTIPEPPTLFDDYSNRNIAAAEQEMEIGGHMDLFDLKLLEEIDSSRLQDFSAYARNMFERLTSEQFEKWWDAYHPKNEEYLAKRGDMTEKEIIQWRYQRYIKDYLRCIAAVDENIGRLLDFLHESGLAENTIVIYSSDQGFYLGEHGWFDKRWMYEESLSTPLIVKWPGVTEKGTSNSDLVQNLDYAETFLEMAGVEIPADMQGKSMVPLLKGDGGEFRDAIYYHYYEYPSWHMVTRHFGVKDDRFKLIYYYLNDEWELFDLKEDSQEMYNLYNRPGYEPIISDMEQKLKELAVQYKDSVALSYL